MSTPTESATTQAAPHDKDALVARRSTLLLGLVCACQFMVILDASIVNVALPSIQGDLHFSIESVAWVVNGYLLTFAGFMLLGGGASDVFGHRRLLNSGLFLFASSSLVAGCANSAGLLVTARLVQGLGAALVAPSTLAVISRFFTKPADRAKAFGAWSASGGFGGIAGAIIGGALTTGLSWRWVFLINVPIGVALIVVASITLPRKQADESRSGLDIAGAIVATTGLAAVIYSVISSADHEWSSLRVVLPGLSGAMLLAGFVAGEAHVERPMLPLRVLAERSVALCNSMLLLFGTMAIAMWYFTSLFCQNVFGYSAMETGLAQTPAAIIFIVTAGRSAALLPKLGSRGLLIIAGVIFFAGFGLLSLAEPGSGYFKAMFGPMLLIAIGIGLAFPTLMATATAGASSGDEGIAGGIAGTAGQVGSAVGLAVLTSIAGHAPSSSEHLASAIAVAGYHRVFCVAALAGVVLSLSSLWLPRQPASGFAMPDARSD